MQEKIGSVGSPAGNSGRFLCFFLSHGMPKLAFPKLRFGKIPVHSEQTTTDIL